MSGCRPVDTPMKPNTTLWGKWEVPMETEMYKRLIDKLINFSHTKLDIVFTICRTS